MPVFPAPVTPSSRRHRCAPSNDCASPSNSQPRPAESSAAVRNGDAKLDVCSEMSRSNMSSHACAASTAASTSAEPVLVAVRVVPVQPIQDAVTDDQQRRGTGEPLHPHGQSIGSGKLLGESNLVVADARPVIVRAQAAHRRPGSAAR